MIPYGQQSISDEDIEAVVAVLRSDYLTQGPKVPLFEDAVATATDAQHAVALNSATSALHIACLALDLGSGDRLWTSPITFVASANCARYCGASVDFVDIDPKTYNMCAIALSEKLEQAEKTGTLPKVIVPVHLAGQSCDMRAISKLAKKYGIKVLEDASHAIGARYCDQPVGDCAYSDIAVFSFHPVKIVTTAEGGVATTNDAALARRMRYLRTHGVTRDQDLMLKDDGPWYYQQLELGYNYRMTELQAALGVTQMDRLDSFVSRRRALAKRYETLLSDLPLQRPYQDPETYSSFHLYIVRVASERHLDVFTSLREQEIGVNLHYIPVHLQPYYERMGFAPGNFPNAEQYYAEAISIPVYAGMSDAQQDEVVAKLTKALD
ncbi:MAG: UDP-4-amino-4,6-dideoxy-N-acetyl-beta-L-altrosamine transaminase [Pseudomonadota bacterium]